MKENNRTTLLIVDDEPDLIAMMKVFLESRGYSCIEAHDGVSGIEKARTLLPNLIILDIKMPKMNGFEVLKALKELPQTRDIPVFFLSGNVDLKHKEIPNGLGVQDYITKPYDNEHLLAVIEKYLKPV